MDFNGRSIKFFVVDVRDMIPWFPASSWIINNIILIVAVIVEILSDLTVGSRDMQDIDLFNQCYLVHDSQRF